MTDPRSDARRDVGEPAGDAAVGDAVTGVSPDAAVAARGAVAGGSASADNAAAGAVSAIAGNVSAISSSVVQVSNAVATTRQAAQVLAR